MTIVAAQNVYTAEMVAEMIAQGPFDNESATAFAAKYDLKVASVRAKAKRNEAIGYVAKVKTGKNGEAVESKSEIVADIAAEIGVNPERLESLGAARKDALCLIRTALSTAD